MRILVTGANGFVGSHIADALAMAGYEVTGLVRPGTTVSWQPRRPIAIRCIDLRDEAGIARVFDDVIPDCVVHAAWRMPPGTYANGPENLDCLSHSLALARVVLAKGCPRFIGVGSCAEYAQSDRALPDDDDGSYCGPRNLYGATKHATRLVLERYLSNADVHFNWARLFFVFGPRENDARLVPSAVRTLLRGGEFACTQGNQIRDYLYVEDIASAIVALTKSQARGVINVCSGEPTTIKELIETTASVVGGSGRVAFGAFPAPAGEPLVILGDNRKLTALGWRRSWSLREALAKTAEWYRARGEHAS